MGYSLVMVSNDATPFGRATADMVRASREEQAGSWIPRRIAGDVRRRLKADADAPRMRSSRPARYA